MGQDEPVAIGDETNCTLRPESGMVQDAGFTLSSRLHFGFLREYFEAGVKLVWYVYPQTRTVRVYTALERMLELGEDQTLHGGDVLPGFSVQIRDWFRRAE